MRRFFPDSVRRPRSIQLCEIRLAGMEQWIDFARRLPPLVLTPFTALINISSCRRIFVVISILAFPVDDTKHIVTHII